MPVFHRTRRLWLTAIAAVAVAATIGASHARTDTPAQPFRVPTPVPHAVGTVTPNTTAPDCGLCWYPLVAPASPAVDSISNFEDSTVTRCDATGGHCARMHIVVQALSGSEPVIKLRSFASVACYSASGDFPCAHIQGSAWLNCTTLNGADCGTDGAVTSCTRCHAFSMITAWYANPSPSHQQNYQGAAGIAFTTGAAGGGANIGLSGVTAGFRF